MPLQVDPFLEVAGELATDDRVRRYLEEFRGRHPAEFSKVSHTKNCLRWLTLVFASSRFLSEELLRHPSWILELEDVERTLSLADFQAHLQRFLLDSSSSQATAVKLAMFRRKELLRILIRDQSGSGDLASITEELSNLADAILACALEEVTRELAPRFGAPIHEQQAGNKEPARFTVLALGKLGGRELNYSSDIDLMFLYSANGETSGPQRVTNKEFFKKVANDLTNLLSTYTPAGQCYRIDLRLRPEGSHGEVCISLAAAKEYYAKRARDWELQMLLKARVAAGDSSLGQELLGSVEPLIYSTTLDFSTIETMSATRERISEKAARKHSRSNEFDVKLARGGIRDIEFLAQCLQRLHGNRESSVKRRGTLPALTQLHDNDLLSSTEFSRLEQAYRFLRKLEHILQFEDDRQIHSLPSNEADLQRVAQRMFGLQNGQNQPAATASTRLLRELNEHLENVQVIYERIVHAQRPLYYSSAPAMASFGQAPAKVQNASHAVLNQTLLAEDPLVSAWTTQLFETSPLLAGQLARYPEFLTEIRRTVERPHRRYAFEGLAAPLNDIEGLRRFFRREMFRIQAGSICLPEPVFQTLDQTSALAEFVVARAYRIALEAALEHARTHAGAMQPFAEPQNEMMVVALGRLGMREFDLGSDADLLFIIPDSESVRHRFWTRVVERLLEILSSYTEGGPILSVDTRLRPNGREGMLVQSESKYVDYLSTKAEAWEGIAYMKARAVAGDTERATIFLTELQQVDWRKYGQGGRSKLDLRQMRLRLQREQGAIAPLKAAQGGYYDADFILMYLRLRGAGMFFKSLNTPERIDVVEKMGHLERADAAFLLEATTHFRALDHALRLVTGHAEGKMPASVEHRQMMAELVNRWTSRPSSAESLETDLLALQTKMRRLFEAVFAQ